MTVAGASVLVADRSARALTVASKVVVLLEGVLSVSVSVTLALFVSVVPLAVFAGTATMRVNVNEVAGVVAGKLASVSVIVPVPPTVTVSVRVQPVGVLMETNVVPVGTAS